jgi:hypothetical protein
MHAPKWLDFTQFMINPCLTGLFADDDRFAVNHGRCDFTLRREPGTDLIFDRTRYPPDIDSLIDGMFFTQPPCKRVMICCWECANDALFWGHSKVLDVLHKEEGINIDHLLSALMTLADDTIDLWANEVSQLVYSLRSMHWKHDIWKVRRACFGTRCARDIR